MRNVLRAEWVAMYAALAAIPLLLVLLGPTTPSRGVAVELAAGLGYVALAMFSLQLAPGARPRVLANRIGLDALLLFHRAAALWATAFVIAHIVLLNQGA